MVKVRLDEASVLAAFPALPAAVEVVPAAAGAGPGSLCRQLQQLAPGGPASDEGQAMLAHAGPDG
jgi:hypothetical protein